MNIEDAQRRLWINNIEIIGLPNPNNNLTDEKMTLDIDACHVVPTNRKDGKRVTVCCFV